MCDITPFKNDHVNHPYFTQRAEVWENSRTIISNDEVSSARATDGLTSDEAACYANHILTKKRVELDETIQEIHNPYNSVTYTYDSNYQITMLTGLVWAALGTTVLYYAFTKI
jgi:hypothetical protein